MEETLVGHHIFVSKKAYNCSVRQFLAVSYMLNYWRMLCEKSLNISLYVASLFIDTIGVSEPSLYM